MKIKILYFFLISVFLVSCDPPHYIDFVNNSNSKAKVKFNINTELGNSDLRYLATGDSIVLNLKPKDTATVELGIGQWSDKEIESVTNSIDKIEIETNNVSTIYKTKDSIKNILENNVEGILLKSRIEIEIK